MAYDKNEDWDDEPIADAPVSPALKVIGEGSEQLDEDAIEWPEVERLIYQQMWGPILELPPTEDDFFLGRQFEDGVDVSAFNTHDFRRVCGEVDRYGYAMAMARKELREAVWMLEMILNRIESPAKYTLLKYLKRGIIERDHCEGEMLGAAIWYGRVRRAAEKIRQIAEARRRRVH